MAERTLFLTGFPGFLARWMLRKWLHVDEGLVVQALVQPSEEASARRALEALSSSGSSGLRVRERVRLVVGDVTAMDLGLSGPEFRELTSRVTEIYHLAAVHELSSERRVAEQVNVQGTANVIAFARAVRPLERLVHFSSAYVSGRRTGVIMEDELDAGQTFRNAYEATKHQGELLMRRAGDRLPVTVIRPAGVVGDSRTGEIDRFDSVYHLGMLLIASPVSFPIPLSGSGSAPLNLLPVDYVVDAVHAILSHPASVGRTYHVVDPNPLPVRRVYETVAVRAGKKLPRYGMPVNLTKALLRIPGMERFASLSHESLDYLDNMAFYNSRNTLEALEGTGLRPPRFEDYVDVLMQYVRDYFERAGSFEEGSGSEVGDRF
ncbi:MAG: SDR family oxidoreductase [Myxococcota bacterium]